MWLCKRTDTLWRSRPEARTKHRTSEHGKRPWSSSTEHQVWSNSWLSSISLSHCVCLINCFYNSDRMWLPPACCVMGILHRKNISQLQDVSALSLEYLDVLRWALCFLSCKMLNPCVTLYYFVVNVVSELTMAHNQGQNLVYHIYKHVIPQLDTTAS